ncbi:MAG TPA: ATP-binding protein [Burkholderiaceae bacterium]|nr:ATP-binding protein [Burkholderiaceae bacterium]
MTTRRPEVEVALQKILAGKRAADLETATLDFKEDKASPGDTERLVAEACICFANAAGGTVVLGVADKQSGKTAFSGTTLTPDRIRQRVFELTRPHLTVSAERHPDHPSLVLVEVPQSSDIHSDTQGRAFRRINLDCLPMTPDQQARLREERRGIDWSAQPSDRSVSDIPVDTLSATRRVLRAFTDERRQLASLGDIDMLTSLGALSSRAELNRAGALMFCSPDGTSATGAVVYQYRATPGGEPQIVQRLESPLILTFGRLMELIAARQSLTPLTLPNGQQITIEDFPSLAVREAVSNAICHRDYHLPQQILIDHSPPVFKVTSPGPLVAGVTANNIITTIPRPRNPMLAKLSRNLGLAEELGRGVDRMYREMIRSGRQIPQIDADFDTVRVTLVGGAPNTSIARFIAQLPEEEGEDTDTMLILFRLCTERTISAVTGAPWLQKSEQETAVILRRLADDRVGLLERTRATSGRSNPTYRLRGSALQGMGSAVQYNRRATDEIDRKVIAHVREYGRITNRTLQNFLDVGVFKARDLIADLVQREILVRISEQQRGPKVEWGPGPKFPAAKPAKRRAARSRIDSEGTE